MTKPDKHRASTSADTSSRRRRQWPLAVMATVALGAVLYASTRDSNEAGSAARQAPAATPTTLSTPPPEYVGQAACGGCHAEQSAAWNTSQHAKAMQHADADTVLGDFGDASFTYNGTTSTFFRRGGKFYVNTDGANGRLADFEIAYTFGVEPLQQYLIAFPDGRLQALSIAWDARPQRDGGQRWFHLYPDEKIDHADELHWTRAQQNWNYMCADCHSTNLRRNYDAQADRYATTWSDLNVACEGCHGPGSNHVAWAEHRAGAETLPDKGLPIALDERRGVHWRLDAASGNARRSAPIRAHREAETCAVCHARRGAISIDSGPTGRLLDTHALALLTEDLYFADGQQRDEVYVHGSFLQSKMYAHGVTCSDCHDPHTARLRAPGDAVCAQCHAPGKYDLAAHHHHEAGGAGAQCVNCHMPERTYMVIDPRRDHSLRVPRPDLSVALGTPNACTDCHGDRDAAWAAAAVERWHGPERKGFQTFASAFDSARRGVPEAASELARLGTDRAVPAIVRATALGELQRYPGRLALTAVDAGLSDPDPLLRAAALDTLATFPPQALTRAVALTDDPVPAVRARAGRALAVVDPGSLTPSQRAATERAFAAFEASQNASAERAEAQLNLGLFHAERGDYKRAEADYRTALRRDRRFVPAYVNLADLYRAQGREAESATVLAEGLVARPDDPNLLHALGLQKVREGHGEQALALLRHAAQARPDNARFAYVYAVALHSGGDPAAALVVLRQAVQRQPYDPELLFALASFLRDGGELAQARDYAQRFAQVAPDDPRAPALLQALERP